MKKKFRGIGATYAANETNASTRPTTYSIMNLTTFHPQGPSHGA
jgi:hypothetical protein